MTRAAGSLGCAKVGVAVALGELVGVVVGVAVGGPMVTVGVGSRGTGVGLVAVAVAVAPAVASPNCATTADGACAISARSRSESRRLHATAHHPWSPIL